MIDVGRIERSFLAVDELLLRLKGLVLVRELLAERGVRDADIAEHDAEIERLRTQLATYLTGGPGGAAAGAAA